MFNILTCPSHLPLCCWNVRKVKHTLLHLSHLNNLSLWSLYVYKVYEIDTFWTFTCPYVTFKVIFPVNFPPTKWTFSFLWTKMYGFHMTISDFLTMRFFIASGTCELHGFKLKIMYVGLCRKYLFTYFHIYSTMYIRLLNIYTCNSYISGSLNRHF